MSNIDRKLEAIRRRFHDVPRGSRRRDGCPSSEEILVVVTGEASPRRNRRLAEHCAVCPECSVSWNLARAYASQTGVALSAKAEPSTDRRASRATARPWLPAAAALAAVVALVAVLVPWDDLRRPDSVEPRSLPQESVESLVPDGASLPADEFTLRWSPAVAGSRYTVRVTDARLRHLAGGVALDQPEFTVPEEALADLSAGEIVLWHVEAVLPGGRRIASRTFASRLE